MKKTVLNALEKSPISVLSKMDEDEIASVIQLANYHYYNTDQPLFSDNTFDIIKEHLEKINPYHPILKHVGAVIDDDRKVKLPHYMGSMDKIKSDSNTIEKWKKDYQGNVVVSDKLDGNSGMFHMKSGDAKLFTRGNGEEGQIITHLLPFMMHIPDITKLKDAHPELTVRGEFIISKTDFADNKDKGANARNMVAGLLNAKVPSLELVKSIQFIAYELITPRMEPSKQLETLHSLGFKVVPNQIIKTSELSTEKLSSVLLDRRSRSEFEIDGVVVYHDALHQRRSGQNPKHAFAFKSIALMDRAEVIVKAVEWNISKDGFLKPVVIFDPVNLSGASIQRATGINGKFIKDNKIGVGAKIVVMRSGDVIPKIIEVTEPAKIVGFPDKINYTWNETGVDIIVNNTNAETELQLKNLEFFFTKVKINGLSHGILDKFQKAGINKVGSVLQVTKEQLLQVDGFKEKMVDKVHASIQEKISDINPISLMTGSNQFGRGIGEKTLVLVSEKFPKLMTDPDFQPSVQDLVSIEGIEKKTAEAIIKGIPAYWKFAKENNLLQFHQQPLKKSISPNHEQLFAGKGFLFTGVRSKDAETFIQERGGDIKSTISKNVDFLICKDPSASSSKLVKAKELGIKVISLQNFLQDYGLIGNP